MKYPQYKRFLFFSFKGRISQPVFFKTYGTILLLFIAFELILAAAVRTEFVSNLDGNSLVILKVNINVILIAYLWVSVAMQAKRVHDLGYSILILVLWFIPLINIGLFFSLMFVPGKRADNKYGPDPLALPEADML